jgi:CRP/FNR family cyclic AMP-dependent transcriptional regulator
MRASAASPSKVTSALNQMLESSPWAARLDAGQRERVRRETVTREVPTHGLVCRKGEPVDAWIGVIEGLVKISSGSFDGKLVTFTGVPAGGWFGEGSLLKDEPRRYDVIALRDSLVAYIPRATFQWLLDSSIAFNRFLLLQLNERLGQFIATVEYERLLGPDARVARCIAQLFNPLLYPGSGRQLKISQAEVGYLTGLSRQRANQALQTLEGLGLIRVEYGGITVNDLAGLSDFEG